MLFVFSCEFKLMSHKRWVFFFLLLLSQDFLLVFGFLHITMWYLCISLYSIWSSLSFLEVWISVSVILGNFWPLFHQIYFHAFFSFPGTSFMCMLCLLVSYISLRLCSFVFIFYPLFFYFELYVILASNLLMFS